VKLAVQLLFFIDSFENKQELMVYTLQGILEGTVFLLGTGIPHKVHHTVQKMRLQR